jgi:hypothetical protein
MNTIGLKVEDDKLVPNDFNGFIPTWKPFFHGIFSHEKLLSLEKLWDDFVYGETRL